MKRVLNILSTMLIVIALALAALLSGVRLFGITPYFVYSGSMEPTCHVGSLVYVTACDASDLAAGDIITFTSGGQTVTHRIAAVTSTSDGQPAFITKGDANSASDANAVTVPQIKGRVLFTLPYLGYLANFLQTTPGRLSAITGCALIALLVFLPSLLPGSRKKGGSSGKHTRRRQ